MQAALQRLPAGRFKRHRLGSAVEFDGPPGRVDVGDLEVAQLGRGGGVEEGEQPDEALVWVGVRIGGPAAEHAALFGQAEGAAPEPTDASAAQSDGRVGEHDPLRSRPTGRTVRPPHGAGAG